MSRRSTASLPPRPGPPPRMSIPVPHVSFPLQRFLATEAGSGVLLLIATVAALIWANIPGGGYEAFWHTEASVRVGELALDLDLRHWVNDLAMALFFLTVGLEISREITVGELRRPRTVVVPVLGAIGGLILPALIYIAFNPSPPGLHGWGVPISTDTAFLVGVLALFGPRCPDQLRLFLLTLAIADDIGAIVVMAVFYTATVSVPALLAALALTLVLFGLRWARVWQLQPYVVIGMLLWVAVFASGVHPTLAGVVVGLLVPATPVGPEQADRLRFYGRAVLERADAMRARLAAAAVRATVPPNDRLQQALHPVSAFLVIPVFGLANAGVRLDAETLRRAVTSPITIGIVVALVAGKTVGISAGAALGLRTGWGELPGRVRYGHLIGGALLAGIGFTISLFIADLAFDDPILQAEAKIGVLAGSLLAAVLGSVALRCLGERLPLCTIDDDEAMPELPTGPWRDPSLGQR
ncbi:Na+/H+ antiporter NhaA [Catellatospora sp. NPDC049609]|uniref:Na+/H+ antiporter NhaA n=1 Tax=Catellatospora sp. NPDC049609 TaxID=3155505 RepID=UPI0034463611